MATVNTVASAPGAVLTSLYTVATGKRAHIKLLNVANIAGAGKTFRVAISPAGAAIADAHYLAYDEALTANARASWSGILLDAGDILRVYGSDANVAFFLSYYEDVA